MGVIDAWAEGGLAEVILPSGLKIKGKIPLIQDMIVNHLADATLIQAVMPLGDKPIEQYDEGERALWITWQRVQAAAYVRYAWNPATQEWEPAVVTPEMLMNGVPPADVDALEDIVLRRRTPAMVSALSRLNAGEITPEELKRIVTEEASGTVSAWSSFRQGQRGDAPGPDGGGVAGEAVEPDRPNRSVRRARARSSPRGPHAAGGSRRQPAK